MDLQLSGKRVLITGASKGIGLGVARVFAEEGCDVVLVARRGEVLEAACGKIRTDYGVTAQAVAADLSRQDEVERVAAEVGAIDVLVNNAGAIGWGDLMALDNAAFRAMWELKVFGYISMCRVFYPVLKARGGVIVNVIGAAGDEWRDPSYIAGSTGNAALIGFTRTLGQGAIWDGVRVVGINPGPVATDRYVDRLHDRARQELGDGERWRELLDLPFGRPAEPEHIGYAAAFLASPRSAATASTVLTIDTGLGRPPPRGR